MFARLVSKLVPKAHRTEKGFRYVHGLCELPEGFGLSVLDIDAPISLRVRNQTTLSTSHNIPKVLIAIVQSIFASISLYQARGDQIEIYGYAAFGLTVLPYLIMSVMNLCAALVLPDYPAVYVVRSAESDEAIAQGGRIDGAIGRLVPSGDHTLLVVGAGSQTELAQSNEVTQMLDEQTPGRQMKHDILRPRSARNRRGILILGFILIPAVIAFHAMPFVIIGILTRFRAGKSTKAERVWTMMWLVLGVVFGPYVDDKSMRYAFIPYAAPAIGGFVVVGQMWRAYGSCTLIHELG